MATTRAYHGEDFCIVHGFEHMRSQFGNPIPFCAACEDEREQTERETEESKRFNQQIGETK